MSVERTFAIIKPDAAAKPGATGEILEIARAGAFARALSDRGAPEPSITIGSQPGNPADLELIFLVRIVDQSKVDFAR